MPKFPFSPIETSLFASRPGQTGAQGPAGPAGAAGAAGAAGLVNVSTVTLTPLQFANAAATPIQLVAGAAGVLLIPVWAAYSFDITIALGLSPQARVQWIGAPFNAFTPIPDVTFAPGTPQKSRSMSMATNIVHMGGANYPIGIGFEFTLTSGLGGGTGQVRIQFGYYEMAGL